MAAKQISLISIQQQINYWQTAKLAWLHSDISDNDDIATVAYKLYLHDSSVARVATELNEMGLRVGSEDGLKTRKFVSNDVSNIIQNIDIPDKDLQRLVRDIFIDHKKFMIRLFG